MVPFIDPEVAIPSDAVPGDRVPGDAVPGDAVPGYRIPRYTAPGDRIAAGPQQLAGGQTSVGALGTGAFDGRIDIQVTGAGCRGVVARPGLVGGRHQAVLDLVGGQPGVRLPAGAPRHRSPAGLTWMCPTYGNSLIHPVGGVFLADCQRVSIRQISDQVGSRGPPGRA